MNITKLIKSTLLVAALGLSIISCDDEATQSFVQKEVSETYVFSDTQGLNEISETNSINVKEILDEIDDLENLDLIKGNVTLIDFDGEANELMPVTLTVSVGVLGSDNVQEVSFENLNVVENEAINFVLPNPIALKPFIQAEEVIVTVKLTTAKALTTNEVTLNLKLDARGLIEL